MRSVETNAACEMTAASLKTAIEIDIENGLIPFFVVATLGTTPTCAFDQVSDDIVSN